MHGETIESRAPRLAMAAAHLAGAVTAGLLLARGGVTGRDAVLLACCRV